MANNKPEYNEASIDILEGLAPVQLRPGQFTRTEHPLHIIQEAIDNSVDEALAGYASRIEVKIHPDNSVSVADNGRGIPVGKHAKAGVPVVEAIFTRLYAGGKFQKTTGASAYTYSGGLHGVGVSVTNALSERLSCTVRRDGHEWTIAFSNGAVAEKLKKGKPTRETGTLVSIAPNPKYFDSPDIPVGELRELLKSKAILLPGLTVVFEDERKSKKEEWLYQDGLRSFLAELAKDEAPFVPVFVGEAYADADDDIFSEGEGASWAFSWFEHGDGDGRSFVNLIPTPQGGTHISGLKTGLFECVKTFAEFHGMMPKGLKLTADDVFKNVRFVLSARMLDPSFANQTKDKLNSRDGVKLVEKMIRPHLEGWMNHNPNEAKVITDIAIRHALARQRASAKVERKRSSSVVMLPGKLADCESDDASRTELFLVEGDSAGGSAKKARDKEYQAILPMRGKGLNTWEKDRNQILDNEEIHDISIAIGILPHGMNEEVDLSKLRYGRICVLADADVDGYHIQTLLLTLFFRHFPQLVMRGHVYVARPPLFRIDADSAGKKRQARKIYAMDEEELKSWQERLRKEGYSKWRESRFKGLGEMDPPELWETTLDPATRRLMRIELSESTQENAKSIFDLLMARSRADSRREWMERRGNEVEV